jgi:hypothetical protein
MAFLVDLYEMVKMDVQHLADNQLPTLNAKPKYQGIR